MLFFFMAAPTKSEQLLPNRLTGLPWGFRGRRGPEVVTVPRLTKRTIEAARPEKGERFIWDVDLPGFGLRVFPSGRKSYVVQYKLGGRGGRTRRIALGAHEKLTPEDAHKRAAKLLAAVADGIDPAQERAEAKQAITIADLADLYLAEGPAEKPNKKASSWQTDRSNIVRHVKPLLGRKLAKGTDASGRCKIPG
jgi:hypothetical protein